MTTGSLRRRVVVATLAVLVVALTVSGVLVTLVYRGSLERDLRHRLVAGAQRVADARAGMVKQVTEGLVLDGVDVALVRVPDPGKPGERRAPIKPGVDVVRKGDLLVATVRVDDVVDARLTASHASIDRAVRRLAVVELAVALGTLLAAGLVLRRATAQALAPLAHVAGVAGRIADGATGERLRPSRLDTELGRMAHAFDRMVDELEASAERSRQGEASMRRFLADASHELRTPVAALQASAETLLREQPGRPDRDALEARLAGDAARLGRLVDELLSLARLEAAAAGEHRPIDLATLAGTAAAEARARAPELRFEVVAPATAPVAGHPEALARALRNLLDNAVAASPSGGRVALSVNACGDEVELCVRDEGPGVPAAERERIFERFVRLDGARNAGGSGLGLAIARRIVLQHGGALHCEPAARGACFRLTLPLAAERV